jgi:hypothetical protein
MVGVVFLNRAGIVVTVLYTEVLMIHSTVFATDELWVTLENNKKHILSHKKPITEEVSHSLDVLFRAVKKWVGGFFSEHVIKAFDDSYRKVFLDGATDSIDKQQAKKKLYIVLIRFNSNEITKEEAEKMVMFLDGVIETIK